MRGAYLGSLKKIALDAGGTYRNGFAVNNIYSMTNLTINFLS